MTDMALRNSVAAIATAHQKLTFEQILTRSTTGPAGRILRLQGSPPPPVCIARSFLRKDRPARQRKISTIQVDRSPHRAFGLNQWQFRLERGMPHRSPEDTSGLTSPDAVEHLASRGVDLPRIDVVVLAVDLVESVRLILQNEADTVHRWTQFVRRVVDSILPLHHGLLVKSLGDGLMARFKDARDAVAAAAAMHEDLALANAGLTPDRRLMLRAGVHAAPAWIDGLDIYGAGVNLAARLATLAGPGETITSVDTYARMAQDLAGLAAPGETVGGSAARDGLVNGVDANCVDLGNCVLKHYDQPVRAYRVGPAGPRPVLTGRRDYGVPMEPSIAVLPFAARNRDTGHFDIGNLIADSIIWRLSKASNLKVISRLSTAVFSGGAAGVQQAAIHLGASYVLSGSYLEHNGHLAVTAELADMHNGKVVWNERLQVQLDDLLQPRSELADQIAQAVHRSIFDTEVQHVRTQPMPTLESYSLLLGAINLMHRSSRAEFMLTRDILDELVHRHNRIAAPRAWLGNWFVLLATRGWSQDRKRDAEQALAVTHAALDRDASDALALSAEGFVYCHLLGDLDMARLRCEQAIDNNASLAQAWLYRGVVDAFTGHGQQALFATRRALELSPLDPQQYYFQSLGATAELAAGQVQKAEELARASLLLNRMHASTWRVLTIALVLQDRMEDARGALRKVLDLDPSLTVHAYRRRMPNGELATGREWARCLGLAGLPAGY